MRWPWMLALALVALLPVARAGNVPAECHLANFTVAFGPEISEATGQHTLPLRLTNHAGNCLLQGYPTAGLSDEHGAIPFAIRHGGDQMLAARRPGRVLVQAGGNAFVVLNQYRCDRGGLRAAKRLRLGTASGFTSISLTDRYRQPNYCGRGDPGSILTVSPFVATLREALR